MAIEDQNPDRLCIPQYGLKQTIHKMIHATRCLVDSRRTIREEEKLQKEKLIPELDKRELELTEWMRRGGKDVAIYSLNDEEVIEVRILSPHNTLTWTVHRVLKP